MAASAWFTSALDNSPSSKYVANSPPAAMPVID